MSKNFKIARKPGQAVESIITDKASSNSAKKKVRNSDAPPPIMGQEPKVILAQSTRKTIEIPEDYFYKVKMRALERKMLEKELWAEIVKEYFDNHSRL